MAKPPPAILGGAVAFPEGLRVAKPTLPAIEDFIGATRNIFASGCLTDGEYVGRLERKIAGYLGVSHCIAVSSCTLGLMLVLRYLAEQSPSRRKVILPSFTFMATGEAVLWNGLESIFADCYARTFNICPSSVEALIDGDTLAVIGVHVAGNPAEVAALQYVTERSGASLIFDSAHALGAKSNGTPIGRFGLAEVFSLSPTKPVTAGEGGIVATRDDDLARWLRQARNYGNPGDYNPSSLGLNARMPELSAALALASLDNLDVRIQARNRAAYELKQRLFLPGIHFQRVLARDLSTYKDFSIEIDPILFGLDRDEVARALLAEGIETRRYFFPPLHRQKLFAHYFQANGSHRLPDTDWLSSRILTLPFHAEIAGATLQRLAEAIERIYEYPHQVHLLLLPGV